LNISACLSEWINFSAVGENLDSIRQAFLQGATPELFGDPVQVLDDYNSLARELFWMDRNLAASRRCLEAGLAYAREQAADDDILGKEKALNYNLGSFCWPGWAEDGVSPTVDDVAAGRQAARRNLELALRLQRGPGPMANAHWLVGAYELHDGDRDLAAGSFASGRDIADDSAVCLLMQAYADLATLDDQQFEANCVKLKSIGGEDADFYVDQLLVAWGVYNFPD
jgi:hypothetical protein